VEGDSVRYLLVTLWNGRIYLKDLGPNSFVRKWTRTNQ